MVKEQIITDEQFIELLDTIQGSIETLDVICSKLGFEESDLTETQLEDIDSHYIHCPNCGWWVEAGDMRDEEHCSDCYDEEDEEEYEDLEFDDWDELLEEDE